VTLGDAGAFGAGEEKGSLSLLDVLGTGALGGGGCAKPIPTGGAGLAFPNCCSPPRLYITTSCLDSLDNRLLPPAGFSPPSVQQPPPSTIGRCGLTAIHPDICTPRHRDRSAGRHRESVHRGQSARLATPRADKLRRTPPARAYIAT